MNVCSAMREVAALQQTMAEAQARLTGQSVEFSSRGGAVTVTVKDDLEVPSVRIPPEALHTNSPARLEDLVRAAVNGGLRAAREMMERELAAVARELRRPTGPGVGR